MADHETKTTEGGPAQVPASLGELQRTTDEVAQMLRELRAAQGSVRRTMLLGSLAIVVVMLAFGGFTYLKVRENLAGPKLRHEAMEQARQLMPQLEAKLKDTLHEVLPVYLRMGKDRLVKIRPELEVSLKDQADKMPAELREDIDRQIDVRFTKITDDADKQLEAAFPDLSGDAGRHAGAQLRTALEGQGQKLREHIMTLATAEMDKAKTTLNSFPIPDVRDTSADTLVRGLIHNLIMLADYEVLATNAPASLDRANLKKDIPLTD